MSIERQIALLEEQISDITKGIASEKIIEEKTILLNKWRKQENH